MGRRFRKVWRKSVGGGFRHVAKVYRRAFGHHHHHGGDDGGDGGAVANNQAYHDPELDSLKKDYASLKSQFDELSKLQKSSNTTTNTNTTDNRSSTTTNNQLTLADIDALLDRRDKARMMKKENYESMSLPKSDAELSKQKDLEVAELNKNKELENLRRQDNQRINQQYNTNGLTTDNFNFINTLKKEYRDRNKYGYSVRDWWSNTRNKFNKIS